MFFTTYNKTNECGAIFPTQIRLAHRNFVTILGKEKVLADI
jgi:hypothetical protein